MILVCPTAFKGTLMAPEVAAAMAAGARGHADEIRVLPLSDGGHGLLASLESAGGGKAHGLQVAGPLGASVTARYLVQEGRVVVETAEACGLHLAPAPLRDPGRASTAGVGQLLTGAAEGSSDPLVVGLGGSASVDAGAGMVTSLGWRLLDRDGAAIPPGARGLLHLHAIEPPENGGTELPELVVLADVRNPLLGRDGAVPVFAPQKGAGPDDLPVLERALERWVRVVERELGADVSDLPGAGAAGGLGAAFAAFLDAPPRPGAEWVLDAVAFDEALARADVAITGEGSWDTQSSMGKITGEVIRRARDAGVPVLLVAGSVTADVPDGVTVATGSRELDAGAVEARVRDALPALLPE